MSNFTKINGINAENVAKIFGVQTENIAKIAGKEPADAGEPFSLFGDTTESGGVYSLDGSGDYVTYNGDHRFTDQFSISVWFKSDGATSSFDTIISNHDGGNIANGNTFMLYPTGKLRVKTADSGRGTTGDALNLGSGLGDSNWHQVVVTWQANTTNGRKIYIDGSLVHQNTTGTAVYRTTAQSLMYLGGMWIYTTNSFSGNGFDGDITGFSIVNSILTAQQVSDSYDEGAVGGVSVPSPALYFDGSSTSSQIGSNTLSNATITTDNGKYENGFIDFGTSGNTNPALFGNAISLSGGTYTFSFWFFSKRTGSDWGSILRRASGGSPANTQDYPIITNNSTDELGLYTESGGQFYSSGFDMTSLEGSQTWIHMAVVANGTNSTFYINGSQAGASAGAVVTTSVQELGAYDGNDSQVFAEGIDEFAHWTSALSAAEIQAIYNSTEKLSDLVN